MDSLKTNMKPVSNKSTVPVNTGKVKGKTEQQSPASPGLPVPDEKNLRVPFAREQLYDSFKGFAAARTDNTRVEIRPIPERKPVTISPDSKLVKSGLKTDDKLTLPQKDFSTAAADKTRVDIQPKPKKTEKKQPIPQPHQTYLSQAPPRDPYREAIQRKQQKYRELQEKLQGNKNMMCQMDPVASQINGHFNFGTPNNPNWQKIGPNPLEGAAMVYATYNPVTSAALTTMSVGSAVKDPTPYNVASASLAVLGSVNLGSAVKVMGQTGQFMKTTNTVNRMVRMEQTATKVSRVAGNVDRVNTGAQVFAPEDPGQ